MPDLNKNWWAPVWCGLVVDTQATHYRRLDGAVWLLLYLILHADRASGVVRCKLDTVRQRTGIPRRTLQRWMRLLRDLHYISTVETGRSVRIAILRWRPLAGVTRMA